MKSINAVILLMLMLSVKAQESERRDTFRINSQANKSPVFKSNNWYKDNWDGTAYLSYRNIPFLTGTQFPGILFFSDEIFKPDFNDTSFTISSDVFLTNNVIFEDSIISNKFFNYLLWPKSVSSFFFPELESKRKDLIFNKSLYITQSTSDAGLFFNNIRCNNGSINFQNNTFPHLSIDKCKTEILAFNSNNLKMTYINDSDIGELSLISDSLAKAIKIDSLLIADVANSYKTSELNVYMQNNYFNLSINNSTIRNVSLLGIKSPFIFVKFENSKITGFMEFQDEKVFELEIPDTLSMSLMYELYKKMDTVQQDGTRKIYITFDKSIVDGNITNIRGITNFNYTFNKCQFGENASLSELNFDTLIISNCTKILTPLFLNISENKRTFLALVNSDLSKIQFEYTDSLTFIPDPVGGSSYDNINNAYLMLLDKFKQEGRTRSFQKLDVEYKQWYYGKKGLLGIVQNAIDRYWWYYGYRKYYVLYWSLAFLLVFAFVNFRIWQSLSQVYPVIQSKKSSYFERINSKNHTLLKSLHVIIVTFFIFFSFRLEFNKINYHNPKILFYFFLQYFIGLVCLFFIVNFILKF